MIFGFQNARVIVLGMFRQETWNVHAIVLENLKGDRKVNTKRMLKCCYLLQITREMSISPGIKECNGNSVVSNSGSSAYTMHKVRIARVYSRQVVVDLNQMFQLGRLAADYHVFDIHVQATRQDVCRNQYIDLICLHPFNALGALKTIKL